MSVLATILAYGTIIVFVLPKKTYLDSKSAKSARAKIEQTRVLDPNHSLIESHKILIATIQKMHQDREATAAKTLNKVIKRVKNEKEIWKFHRMRNKVAHETDFIVSEAQADNARNFFAQALDDLCARV